MASKASAVWTGSLKEGKGTISTATGVLNNANYSFATRFEGATSGTTPEELIAAAHASCFSMALGAQLGGAGLTPTKIETHAAVTLAKVDGGFAITKIALTTTASVPGATKEVFDKAAADAKAGCPISKLFANNTEITLGRQAGLTACRKFAKRICIPSTPLALPRLRPDGMRVFAAILSRFRIAKSGTRVPD